MILALSHKHRKRLHLLNGQLGRTFLIKAQVNSVTATNFSMSIVVGLDCVNAARLEFPEFLPLHRL